MLIPKQGNFFSEAAKISPDARRALSLTTFGSINEINQGAEVR